MKRLLILAALALPLVAQNRYAVTTGTITLAGTTTAITLQQPGVNASPATIQLESAVIYCSANCVVNQTQNGTAATATAATIVSLTPVGQPSSVKAFTASNTSGGTSIPPSVNVPTGSTVVLDLSKMIIPKGNGTSNYTISIPIYTGDVNITITWSERTQ